MKRTFFLAATTILLIPQVVLANPIITKCEKCEVRNAWPTQRFYPTEPIDINTSIENPSNSRTRVAIDINESYTVQGRRYQGGESHIWVEPKGVVPITIHNEEDDVNHIRMDAWSY